MAIQLLLDEQLLLVIKQYPILKIKFFSKIYAVRPGQI